MNRAERRRKAKNRQFTKKGMTRVLKVDDNNPNKVWNIPTPVGSKLHHLAQHNVKRMKKAQGRGE